MSKSLLFPHLKSSGKATKIKQKEGREGGREGGGMETIKNKNHCINATGRVNFQHAYVTVIL